MAFLQRTTGSLLKSAQFLRHTTVLNSQSKRFTQIQPSQDKGPVKFTSSEANINYKATRNFYGDDRDLPPSHNIVLASSCILGLFYLFFLRDDIDTDGGVALFKPIHEQIPEYAIPMLQAAIVENRKMGYNTQKLEKKLAEYMAEPEKYGGDSKKMVEN